MKKFLPEPIAFAGSMLFLATAAIAFALLNPEVRLWLQNMPPGLNAAVGAFAGTVIGLLGIAAAIVYHARSEQDARAARETDDARVLAAAIHGEITALGQWLTSQAAAQEENGRNDLYRSSDPENGPDYVGFSTRPVYEANAARLDVLGPNLAAAVAYCHAVFEQAEWQHNAALSRGNANGSRNLMSVEAKLRMTAGYLAAFAANEAGQIDEQGRDALFANSNDRPSD
jgi:hypothetical protein